MKITKLVEITYDIDDDTLLEYIKSIDEDDDPKFYEFIDWIESKYYIDDFFAYDDVSWEDDSQKFYKQINKLKND